jgi:hypothetical protein
MEAYLPYLIGFAIKTLMELAKIKIPGLPTPTQDSADVEATDFLNWLLKVKSGQVVLDAKDREVLRMITQALPTEVVSK